MLDLLLLRAWHIKKEIKDFATSAGNNISVLDAGAGFGQYVYSMTRINRSWNITGVDVKDEQIEDCNNFFSAIGLKDKVNFEKADLTKFKNNEAYNLIVSVDVMEHILEDVLVFKNFHASLKENGMLLISTPSDQGGSDAHHDHDHEHEDGDIHGFIDEHVRDGYNINEIEDKLKSAGFSKVETKYAYGKPGKISWKISMKYPIIILNTSKLFFILLPFYYIIVFPISYILNFLDVNGKHQTGTGLVVKAWK